MFCLHQDQHTEETGWAWTNENPSVVGSHSPDCEGLRSVSGGPGTHAEVPFTLCFFFGVWVTVDSLMSTTMDQLTYCKLCDCLSGDFSSSMTKASWGKSLWTIFLWGDLWMRLCDWCRPSSTQTNMAKVQNSSYFLCTCLHTWIDFFFSSCMHIYI